MLRTQTAVLFLFALLFGTVLDAQEDESCFSFELESRSVLANEPFCVDVKANGFEELLLFQWSIRYDPSVLEFTEVTNFNLPGSSENNFGRISEGPDGALMGVSWSSPSLSAIDIDDSAPLFSICFQPLVGTGITYVEFYDYPTPFEVIIDPQESKSLSVGLSSAEIRIGEEMPNDLSIEQICLQPGNCDNLGATSVEVAMAGRGALLSYNWTGLGGVTTDNPVFEAPIPGFYQLEVVDAEGNRARGGVFISESIREKLVFASVEPIPCDQETGGRINLTARDPNASYSFLWSNGATTQSLEDIAPGIYTVTITNTRNACQSLELFEMPYRQIEGDTEVICLGEDFVNVRALLYGVAYDELLTFEWNTGETIIASNESQVQIPLVENDAYAVTITTEDDCSIVLEGELPVCDMGVDPPIIYDGCLVHEIGQTVVEQGEIACVDVRVRGFKDMLTFQYTLQWDPEKLDFREVSNLNSNLRLSNFGLAGNSVENGTLTTSWVDEGSPRGATIEDGEILYSLCFKVLSDSGVAPVTLQDATAGIEASWTPDLLNSSSSIPFSIIDGGFYLDINPMDYPRITDLCVSGSGCGDTRSERITVTVMDGVSPYTYNWEGPDNFSSQASSFEAPSLGVYYLTVGDANGATATATVQVKDTDVYPNTLARITSVSCDATEDGSIKLNEITDPLAYSFLWSNGETTRDISNLSVGAYTVTITENARGCTTVESYEVHPEDIRASLYYSCTDSLTAEVTAAVILGRKEEFTFSWSSGIVEVDSVLSTIQVMQGDTVNVAINNDRGCTYVSQLIVPECPAPTDDNEFTASFGYNCSESGESAIVTAYVFGNPLETYTYIWNTGFVEEDVRSSSITVPTGSIYSVMITDSSGGTEVLGGIKPDCSGPEPLVLSIGEANTSPGSSVCLAVRAENFNNILGLQYAVSWDPVLLELASLQHFSLPDLDESHFNFGADNYVNGSVNLSWIDPSGFGASLANDALLYEMCFDVTGDEGEVAVFFDAESLQLEVVNENVESVIPSFKDGLVIINGEERVWPGDTDNNEVANHYDLLNIGLAYGAVGPIREGADLTWRGQIASDWNATTPDTGVDFKHVDSNGDGVINALDTTAISLNWGRAVNLMPNPLEEYRSSSGEPKTTGAPIFIEALPVQPGETVSFNVNLGDDDNPVTGAYGVAFSIVYDPLAVVYGSVSASFENSWLGQLGEDMIALYRDDPNQHRLHIALTRIDQVEVDGSGAIGQISMTIEDVIFRDREYEMPFRVENVRLIRADEEEVQVVQKQTIGTILDTPLSSEERLPSSQIKLFPNPTYNFVQIDYQKVEIDRIQLLNLQGKVLREYQATDRISLQDLQPSTYLLRFMGPQGVVLKKMVKL
ncbi:MAG: T9SS type A sorting domain-containing protein [Cyanothece sp. SIO1E1]|nr:T9SS type A sorting domain-containing protein [Cyanothece sp. SIO1E1]